MTDSPLWQNGRLVSASEARERDRLERELSKVERDLSEAELFAGRQDGLRQQVIDKLRKMATLHPDERGWAWAVDALQRELRHG